MRLSIGIFTAEASLASIKELEAEMTRQCDITYLSYSAMRQLSHLYVQNIHQFDGVLFSGRLPYTYLVHDFGMIQKPFEIFEVNDRDYYKVFAKLLYQYPGLHISRVFTEEPQIGFKFCEIFNDERPQYIPANFTDSSYVQNVHETMLNEAVQRWRRNEIDVVLTRLRNLVEPLKEAGIPTVELFPSKSSRLETFHNLCRSIQTQKLSNSQTVYGIIASTEPGEIKQEALRTLLNTQLETFNQQNSMSLIIRRMENSFDLISSNEMLLDITRQYTDCLLSRFLHETVGPSIHVGWGVGTDIVQAQKNARVALRQAGRSPQNAAFVVTGDGELVGPLLLGKSVAISETPDQALVNLSREVGISTKNLQKLISVQEKRGITHFTSADLAFYLNITLRSANRLLKKLIDFGAAEQTQAVQTHVKGRPYMMYEIDYRKLYHPSSSEALTT